MSIYSSASRLMPPTLSSPSAHLRIRFESTAGRYCLFCILLRIAQGPCFWTSHRAVHSICAAKITGFRVSTTEFVESERQRERERGREREGEKERERRQQGPFAYCPSLSFSCLLVETNKEHKATPEKERE